ncbi:MAG: DEAD/DEAH box helicase [Casimicrobiaceae bacterium]
MPASLADCVTRDAIEALADARTLARGRTYFRDGAVGRLQIAANEVRADVVGTQRYCVRLAADADGEIDYACSCPIGEEGEFCKHAVALGLAWLAHGAGRDPGAGGSGATRQLFPQPPQVREPPPPPEAHAPAAAAADTHKIALALALLWTYRSRSALISLLAALGWQRHDRRPFTQDDVKRALAELRLRGSLCDMPRREGYFRLADNLRSALYRELLDSFPAAALRSALQRLDAFRPERAQYQWPLYDPAATIAFVRLELFSGTPAKDLGRLRETIGRTHNWNEVAWSAAFPAFDAALFERITPSWRWDLASIAVNETNGSWRADVLPLCEWAVSKVASGRAEVPHHLRLAAGEFLIHRRERGGAVEALEGLDVGAAGVLRAALQVQEGRWSDAQAAFESAMKLHQREVGARSRTLPATIAWLYPLALLAQQTPRHLALARKFCLGEAGKRKPSPFDGWGRWAHAIDVRLGDAALEPHAFDPAAASSTGIDGLWKLMLAAWLGRDALGWDKGKWRDEGALARRADALRQPLAACGFTWLAAQVDAAEAVLRDEEPPAGFFASGPREHWRAVLAALQALGAEAAPGAAGTESSRIVWALRIGKRGALQSIEPLEQKRGPRGWSKPKPTSLARIAGSERLPPWDAKVARAIRQDRVYARSFTIDRAAAVMALIGHPAIVLADAPEQTIDLVEGTPEIEVVKEGDGYLMQVTPALRADGDESDDEDDSDASGYHEDAGGRRDAEALRTITLVQDTPQRVRVIRLTAAQRRAAQLLARRTAVPASAGADLQQALHALAGHFQVHADHAQPAQEVAADSRLRAELWPVGELLMLRIVVAPLGPAGPRLPPGVGRARLMAAVDGETVGTRRDLAAERTNIVAVQDALPWLDEPADASGGFEWAIADAEQALDTVEALPKLPGVAAVEWPKGKPVRVHTVDAPQLALVVTGERDWFRLRGRAAVDENLVLDFETLLAAAQARSRFVPMGDGVYVALTRSLKQRLNELAAVVEPGKDGVRVPRIAAGWLDMVLEGAPLQSDREFRAAIERLHAAQAQAPSPPSTLQAELRAYQADGFAWAMRLAAAGLGGCLADDMGLGKTLQGLAVLLARAPAGAALVIAPTSVCGNWQAEALRFAPTLNVAIYGEAQRDSLIANAGPMDVIVVSYALLQQARERFGARTWHTVIADEAQAIKNAAAKRSLAVFDLAADFKLALTGTPVENRLSELWSIMRFANPGLLGSLARFNERFAVPIERERDRDAQQLLRRLIGPFMLRRTKAQVLQELPPRTELVVAVVPDAAETAHYEALRRQAIADADRTLSAEPASQARLNILAQLTRLRRAACDPRLASPGFAATGAKVQAFRELATELVANGHKTLVFSQFVDFLTLLRQPLDAAGIAYQYLDGATPGGERTRRVAAFQSGEGDLFLISLKAGGFGLNLTAADYVLITDPWWNPAAEDQATGRAHRIGQSRPVTVYRFVTRGTVEERIVALHHDKRALADSILAEGEAVVVPSAADLLALMRGD